MDAQRNQWTCLRLPLTLSNKKKNTVTHVGGGRGRRRKGRIGFHCSLLTSYAGLLYKNVSNGSYHHLFFLDDSWNWAVIGHAAARGGGTQSHHLPGATQWTGCIIDNFRPGFPDKIVAKSSPNEPRVCECVCEWVCVCVCVWVCVCVTCVFWTGQWTKLTRG